MALDKDAVAKIARLARIRITGPEVEILAVELSHILGWIEQLEEVDTSNAAPMTSVTAAPSVTIQELPGVTVPWCRSNAGRSFASASMLWFARGPTSVSIVVS